VEREIVANAFHHANWGVPIAVYFWLVGSSAGSFVISSLGWVFGIKKYKQISFFASNLGLVQLLIVPVLLVFDLGKIGKFINLFPVVGFWHGTSPMAWGAILVGLYPVGMVIYSYLIYVKNEKWARIFGLIAVVQAISTHWYTGVVMQLNPARHPNHTAMAALLFLIGAFVSGIGLLNLCLWIRDKLVDEKNKLDPQMYFGLAQLMLIGIVFDLFLVFSEFMQMNYGTEEEYHVLELVRSVFYFPVVLVYIGGALIVPLVIFISPFGKTKSGVLIASACTAGGIFGMRIGWVLISQFSQTFF
jgi:molybdopterin-containing oxidoreductase family membrane subunit